MAYRKKKKEGIAWQSKCFRLYNDILNTHLKNIKDPLVVKLLHSLLELAFYDGYLYRELNKVA